MIKNKLIYKFNKLPLIERAALLVAIAEPLSTVPQIIDVYRLRSAESLSLLTWLLFVAFSFVWLAYGIKIKNQALVVSSLLWASTELFLIAGIIIYP